MSTIESEFATCFAALALRPHAEALKQAWERAYDVNQALKGACELLMPTCLDCDLHAVGRSEVFALFDFLAKEQGKALDDIESGRLALAQAVRE